MAKLMAGYLPNGLLMVALMVMATASCARPVRI